MIRHETWNAYKMMRRMSRDHLDLLREIESILVSAWRNDPGVDDAAARAALDSVLGEKPSAAGSRAADLAGRLAVARSARAEVGDEDWRNGLRVVRDSVDRHSSGKPGGQDYLRFVGQAL